MSLQVEFPEEVVVASREERAVFARKVILYMLAHLYEQGKISAGLGAQVLGISRLEFYRLISEHGFSVIDYTADELEAEVQSSKHIAARTRTK